MINQITQIPLAVWAVIVVGTLLFLANLRISRSNKRSSGAYQPQGPDRSLDVCFLEQPTKIRHGVVAERKEVMLPQYTFSAVKQPRPTVVPHYVFTIICHDVIPVEKLELVAEKDAVNVLADVGRSVEVKSQFSGLDNHHMVHSILAV